MPSNNDGAELPKTEIRTSFDEAARGRRSSASQHQPAANLRIPETRNRSSSQGSSDSVAVTFPGGSHDAPNTSSSAGQARRGTLSVPARRRGMSRSSHTTVLSSAASVFSRRSERSRSHYEEDAASDDSVGETDDDVCFPLHSYTEDDSDNIPGQGINIGELDQLLNLSDGDEEDGPQVPQFTTDSPSYDQAEEFKQGSSEPLSSGDTIVAGSNIDQVKSPDQLKLPFIPLRGPNHDAELADFALPNAYQEFPEMHPIKSMQNEDDYGGAESQRFSFFGSSMESTIHSKDLASLVGPNESFSNLFEPKNGVWWLDCYDPSDQEMKILSRAFGIHPLTAEDIRMEESREKFEMFRKYYFISFHTFGRNPANEETYLEPINFYIIVFSDGILSFHFTPVSHTRNVRRRMRQLRDYVTVTSDWIAYALIDDITDSFAPIIHEIDQEADYVEDHVYVPNSSENMSTVLRRLSEARKRTMKVLRLLTGKADVIRGLAKRCTEQRENAPRSEIALYLGDIQDHIVTMYQNLVAYEKIFSRSHVNYMAQLQMEFVNSSNNMTSVLGKATLIGTVLVPMNLITGLFGMNVKIPGQQGPNLGWFFGIVGVMLLLIVVFGGLANFWISRAGRMAQ